MANSPFHHEEILRGKDLVKRLAEFRIVVCGDGAIGSNLVGTLTRQGFSNLCVIDFDRVDTHNVNTQEFDMEDVGALKVTATQSRVFRTVEVDIDTIDKKLDAKTVKKFLKGADLVVDGFDNNEARQIVQDHCRKEGIDCLHAGMDAEYGEVVWDEVYTVPKDGEGVDVCDYPLARNLIMVTVSIAAEEILDHCLAKTPRRQSWAFTLKDLKIGPYR